MITGTYEHWKGRQYLVIGLGHDADDPDRTVVVYLPLYPVEGPPFAVRTLEEFSGWVDPATGATLPEGRGVPRFRLIDSGSGKASEGAAPTPLDS